MSTRTGTEIVCDCGLAGFPRPHIVCGRLIVTPRQTLTCHRKPYHAGRHAQRRAVNEARGASP